MFYSCARTCLCLYSLDCGGISTIGQQLSMCGPITLSDVTEMHMMSHTHMWNTHTHTVTSLLSQPHQSNLRACHHVDYWSRSYTIWTPITVQPNGEAEDAEEDVWPLILQQRALKECSTHTGCTSGSLLPSCANRMTLSVTGFTLFLFPLER